jgi:hypothetical protein
LLLLLLVFVSDFFTHKRTCFLSEWPIYGHTFQRLDFVEADMILSWLRREEG